MITHRDLPAHTSQPIAIYGATGFTGRLIANCAGPFVDLGKPLVNGAIRNGVHYADPGPAPP